MQPFSTFEAVAKSKPGQEIAQLSDVRSIVSLADCNPVKSIMGLFLADFLYVVLKESAADDKLSQFLFDSVAFFAQSSPAQMANFHLMFLYRLGFFLGIQPDMGSYHAGRCFDMREARFLASMPTHCQALAPEQARMVSILSRLHERNLHLLKLNRLERNEVLDSILDFYTLHYAPVGALASLAVVRDVFA